MSERIYVSGPVTGIADGNLPAFERARHDVYEQRPGATVLLPHWFVPAGADWQHAMRSCIETLVKCDAVALLPGWRDSHGARTEAGIAQMLGMALFEVYGGDDR